MEEEVPLSSTASGYAATGSGSSLDTKYAGTPLLLVPGPNQAEGEPQLVSQFSYPLQKLLTRPYNPESDDIHLLDPPLNSSTSVVPHGINDVRNNHRRLHLLDHTHHEGPQEHPFNSNYLQGRWEGAGRAASEDPGRRAVRMVRHGKRPRAVNSLQAQHEFYSDHNHVTIEV